MTSLVTLLVAYPLWAGERGIAECKHKKNRPEFPPSEGELRPYLESQVKVHRYAAEWEQDAAKTVEGRQLLAGPERKRMTAEEMRDRYGENWGLKAMDPARPRPFRTLDELKEQFGEDALDAVPDAKDYWPVRMSTTPTLPAAPIRSHGAAAE